MSDEENINKWTGGRNPEDFQSPMEELRHFIKAGLEDAEAAGEDTWGWKQASMAMNSDGQFPEWRWSVLTEDRISLSPDKQRHMSLPTHHQVLFLRCAVVVFNEDLGLTEVGPIQKTVEEAWQQLAVTAEALDGMSDEQLESVAGNAAELAALTEALYIAGIPVDQWAADWQGLIPELDEALMKIRSL